MEHRIAHDNMDETLKKLENDYVKAVRDNEHQTVEGFIEQFLYDSWEYNDQNIDMIQSAMKKYAQGKIEKSTFQGAFNEMVDHLYDRLEELDEDKRYPMLHQPTGASILVALVDGLVIQYFTNVYSVEDLQSLTPHLKETILNALKTKV